MLFIKIISSQPFDTYAPWTRPEEATRRMINIWKGQKSTFMQNLFTEMYEEWILVSNCLSKKKDKKLRQNKVRFPRKLFIWGHLKLSLCSSIVPLQFRLLRDRDYNSWKDIPHHVRILQVYLSLALSPFQTLGIWSKHKSVISCGLFLRFNIIRYISIDLNRNFATNHQNKTMAYRESFW